MSNETSTQREAKFAAWRMQRDMRAVQSLGDQERKEFLQRLDEADFEVTDWEAEFIECALVWRGAFTEKMRGAIHKLRCKYEPHLKNLAARANQATNRNGKDTGIMPAPPQLSKNHE